MKFYPSTDLHLLRGMAVTCELLFNDSSRPLNDWVRASGFDLALPPGVTVATVAGVTITASPTVTGTAATWLIMRSPAGGAAAGTIPVRITVHQTLHRLWCSATNLRLETGRNDRVLVVYAEFEDAAGARVIVDVTGRDFLDYGPPTPGFAIGPDGRVTTTTTPGTWTVTIGVVAGLGVTPVTGSVTIEVVAAPTDLPILRQHHSGTEVTKRSILLIAEGFTAATEQEFHDLCKLLTLKLAKVAPYSRLMESLDVYGAFVPSAEEGITVGADVVRPASGAPGYPLYPDDSFFPRVLQAVGHPAEPGAPVFPDLAAFVTAAGGAINARNRALWQQTFDVWKELGAARPTRVRETAFGLTITYPHRGPHLADLSPPLPGTLATWLRLSVTPRGPARAPFFPDHRLPPLRGTPPLDPDQAHDAMLKAFLGKLRMPGGPTTTGARWLPGGNSEGLVVFLCRCDLYGGVNRKADAGTPVASAAMVSTGNMVTTAVANSTIQSGAPPPFDPFLLDVVVGITSSYQPRPILEMTDVLAHELAHSPGLGALNDEYGGQAMSPLPAAAEHRAESMANTHVTANVQSATGIDPTLLKWRWPRAEAGAVVEDCFVSGTDVAFVINLSHATRWKRRTGPRPVWVRHGPLWQVDAPVGPILVNPLEMELVSFDPVAQIVRCKPLGAATAAGVVDSFWTQRSLGGAVPDVRIVLQRVDAAGNRQWIIPPAVATELNAHGPLITNNCPPGAAANRTAALPGLKHSTPAAYEGASSLNCGVLRPAQACKLSRRMEPVELFWGFTFLHAEDFCAVCQYVMTHELDVSLLPSVDHLL